MPPPQRSPRPPRDQTGLTATSITQIDTTVTAITQDDSKCNLDHSDRHHRRGDHPDHSNVDVEPGPNAVTIDEPAADFAAGSATDLELKRGGDHITEFRQPRGRRDDAPTLTTKTE